MKYKHYAPKAPLTLVEGPAEKIATAMEKEILSRRKQGEIVGVMASEEVLEELGSLLPDDLGYCYGGQGDLPAIAASLYEGLRYFDDTEAESLLAEGTTSEGLGLAIMNRLRKASGFNSLRA
jgi:L-threonylcarbamoyladenylate synthase